MAADGEERRGMEIGLAEKDRTWGPAHMAATTLGLQATGWSRRSSAA